VSLQQLPALVVDFRDMAKEYLIQETVLPAKRLGHLAGYSLGAAAAWAAAIVLLAVASVRAIIEILPDSPYWEALGYLLTVLALVALAAVLVKLGPETKDEAP
jgi:hypothetical protein